MVGELLGVVGRSSKAVSIRTSTPLACSSVRAADELAAEREDWMRKFQVGEEIHLAELSSFAQEEVTMHPDPGLTTSPRFGCEV